jgi:hypothetical protein
MEGYEQNHDKDDPAPDEDYVIASTGIVKALGVCLGTGDGNRTPQSKSASPTASGAATPKQGPFRPRTPKKPKDVSLELCEAARKIRMRLRPALIKQDKEGNDMEFRESHPTPPFYSPWTYGKTATNHVTGRLFFLDQTLARMIQRFEDEYPESKIPPMSIATARPETSDLTSLGPNLADASVLSASVGSDTLAQVPSGEEYIAAEEGDREDTRENGIKMSRTSSNTSLAAKAYMNEEGRMHRFGQGMRREVLRPTGMTDYAHGTFESDAPEPSHLATLRKTLEELQGEEIREKVEREGGEKVIRDLGVSARELRELEEEDPEGFEKFKGARFAMALNSGRSWEEAMTEVGMDPGDERGVRKENVQTNGV